MGWCHEFGVQVFEGCGHPMEAGESACSCRECGFVCPGKFGGCESVWAASRLVQFPRQAQSRSPASEAAVTQARAAAYSAVGRDSGFQQRSSAPTWELADEALRREERLAQAQPNVLGRADAPAADAGTATAEPVLEATQAPPAPTPPPAVEPALAASTPPPGAFAAGPAPAFEGLAPPPDTPLFPTEQPSPANPVGGAGLGDSPPQPEPPPASPEPAGDRGLPVTTETGSEVLAWLRDEFQLLESQLQSLASNIAHQQTLLFDVGRSRGAELNASLAEIESRAAELHIETSRIRGLQETLGDRLTGAVADAVTPELRTQLPMVLATLQGDVGRYVVERLAGQVADTIRPDLTRVLTETLPDMVALAVRPEQLPEIVATTLAPALHDLLGSRLPEVVQDVVQPELRSILAAHLPDVVAATVQPGLTEGLPGMVAAAVHPELRAVLAQTLPDLLAAAVEPELRLALSDRLSEVVKEAVQPDISASLAEMEGSAAELRTEAAKLETLRATLAERLPGLLAGAMQAELQALGQRVPELVADAVQPEVRSALPAAVAEAVESQLRETLAEHLPGMVADTVQPELQQALGDRLAAVVAGAVQPDVSASLAELEGSASLLRGEATKFETLRIALSERLPALLAEACQAELKLVAQQLPAMVAESVQPELRWALPGVVAETVQPELRTALAERLPKMITDAVQPELRSALAERLPNVVADTLYPELRAALAERLPGIVAEAIRPELRATLSERLPAMVAESVQPELRAALSERLPGMVADAVQPEVRWALAERLPGMVAEGVQPELRWALAERLPGMVADAVRPEVRATLAEWLPTLLAESVQPEVSASLAHMEGSVYAALEQSLTDRLPPMVSGAVQPQIRAAFADLPAMITGAVEKALEGKVVETVTNASVSAVPAAPPMPALPEVTPGAAAVAQQVAAPAPPAPPAAAPPPPAAPPSSEAPANAPVSNPAAGHAVAPAAVDRARADLEALVEPGGLIDDGDDVPAEAPEPEASADDEVPDDGEGTDEGLCTLPGVVAGPTLATSIAEAVHRARLRRRRSRRAEPPSPGLRRRDPFSADVGGGLERFASAKAGASRGSNGDGAQADGGGFSAALVVAGQRDGEEVRLDLTRGGGVALLGSRSADAARALLTTFLATNGPDLARAIMIGNLIPGAPAFPGLVTARSVGSVLGGLQAEVTRRTRLLAAGKLENIAAYQARHPEEPLPILVVATRGVSDVEAPRLRSLLQEGARLGVVGLLVDTPLAGLTTVRLGAGGSVAEVQPEDSAAQLVGARLFTLGPDAAGHLLGVLASARSDDDAVVVVDPEPEAFTIAAVPNQPLVSVRLLGGYHIEARGKEIRSGLRAKARELLAFYLLHPDGTTLEAATEALWPEADSRRGSEWFWTALGNLRSLLRTATGNTKLKIIERHGDRYKVEPIFDVDLWRFQAALSAAGSHSNGADASWAAALRTAAESYGGELLHDVDWPWAVVPREDLRRRAVDVLVSLAATRLVAGDIDGALQSLQQAVDVDPLAEQIYRRIMRLHAKRSRTDDVASTYRRLETRLKEQGLEPTPESEQLHRELCGVS